MKLDNNNNVFRAFQDYLKSTLYECIVITHGNNQDCDQCVITHLCAFQSMQHLHVLLNSYEMGSVWYFYLGIYLGKIPIEFELFVYSASTFLVEFAMIVYAVDGA